MIEMVEILKQGQYQPMPVAKQVISIFAAVEGFLDTIPVEHVARFEKEFHSFINTNAPEVEKDIAEKKEITEETRKRLLEAAKQFSETFVVEVNPPLTTKESEAPKSEKDADKEEPESKIPEKKKTTAKKGEAKKPKEKKPKRD